jgi:hypothetical protein
MVHTVQQHPNTATTIASVLVLLLPLLLCSCSQTLLLQTVPVTLC